MKDFITVGIIARNESQNIGRTLNYLVEQDYGIDNFGVILIDGNSTDGTREIATQILSDSGVQFKVLNEKDFQNPEGGPNFGHCFARNLVIDNVFPQSKYIAFLDGDCRTLPNRLSFLQATIKDSAPDIAGAGGTRFVETKGNVSDKELVFNYYFTSTIMSLGNPAFAKRDVKYLPSIAGYNSIYKIEILQKFRYDSFLLISDDVEINHRIAKAGYKFLYSPEAVIYHRETDKLGIFLKGMFRYGQNIANAVRKHKEIIRLYVPISILFFAYTVLLPILMLISYFAFQNLWIPLYPYLLVLILGIAVFIENIYKTKTLYSLVVFLLVPAHVFLYGAGVALSLLDIKRYARN